MSNFGFGEIILIAFVIAFLIFVMAGFWKVFQKAGYAGWECIVPIYNYYIMTKIADKPGWWTILMCIPYLNIIAFIVVSIGISENFNKGAGFGVGLALLSFIFWPILGFGDAEYKQGPLEIEDNLVE